MRKEDKQNSKWHCQEGKYRPHRTISSHDLRDQTHAICFIKLSFLSFPYIKCTYIYGLLLAIRVRTSTIADGLCCFSFFINLHSVCQRASRSVCDMRCSRSFVLFLWLPQRTHLNCVHLRLAPLMSIALAAGGNAESYFHSFFLAAASLFTRFASP